MVKIIRPFLLGLTTLVSISALASTCPSYTDVICIGSKWGVRTGGWAQASTSVLVLVSILLAALAACLR